jgi:hypothetical protein
MLKKLKIRSKSFNRPIISAKVELTPANKLISFVIILYITSPQVNKGVLDKIIFYSAGGMIWSVA